MNYNFNWTVIEKNIVPMLEGLGFGLLMAIIAITTRSSMRVKFFFIKNLAVICIWV